MPTGISGLYKNTRGAIAANKSKYSAQIKKLSKAWAIGAERAFDVIMKRVDKGLPPLPPSLNDKIVKDANLLAAKGASAEKVTKMVEKAVGGFADPKKKVAKKSAPKKSIPAPVELLKDFIEKGLGGKVEVVNATPEEIKKILGATSAGPETDPAVLAPHYDLPKPIKETIELVELVMARKSIPRVQAYMISHALRYILRLGVKTSDWKTDAAKAENYLHRAITGEWITKKA